MLLVFVLQICYCVSRGVTRLELTAQLILVLARKPETKAALLNGVGLRFPLVNAAFALWVVCVRELLDPTDRAGFGI